MKFELRHRLPKSPERAWKLLFSDEYEAITKAKANITRTVLDSGERDGHRYRKVHDQTNRKVPAPFDKVLGTSEVTYDLEERFDDEARKMWWTVIPSRWADRVRAAGCYEVRGVAEEDECERIVSGEVTVDFPVIGKQLERIIGDKLKASYERSTGFTQEWLKQHD